MLVHLRVTKLYRLLRLAKILFHLMLKEFVLNVEVLLFCVLQEKEVMPVISFMDALLFLNAAIFKIYNEEAHSCEWALFIHFSSVQV